jgi:hypothetical protein
LNNKKVKNGRSHAGENGRLDDGMTQGDGRLFGNMSTKFYWQQLMDETWDGRIYNESNNDFGLDEWRHQNGWWPDVVDDGREWRRQVVALLGREGGSDDERARTTSRRRATDELAMDATLTTRGTGDTMMWPVAYGMRQARADMIL